MYPHHSSTTQYTAAAAPLHPLRNGEPIYFPLSSGENQAQRSSQYGTCAASQPASLSLWHTRKLEMAPNWLVEAGAAGPFGRISERVQQLCPHPRESAWTIKGKTIAWPPLHSVFVAPDNTLSFFLYSALLHCTLLLHPHRPSLVLGSAPSTVTTTIAI